MRLAVRRALATALAGILATYFGLMPAWAASAQAGESPAVCRVGVYLVSLHDFDPGGNSFGADFWLWSVCPSADQRPLQTMEFINADAVTVLLESTETRGSATWSQRKITGTFRNVWNDANFPFDRHDLTIVMEEGVADARQLVLQADAAGTAYDPRIDIPGWKITGFDLHDGVTSYNTTFGDPTLPPDSHTEYSRLTLETNLVRTDLSGFFKLTVVGYAAFIFSLLAYATYRESVVALSQQMGLLAGALFAAAVSMVTASAALGSESGLNLVDKIHIVVLVYILTAALIAIFSHELREKGWDEAAIGRLNIRIGLLAAVTFIAINLVLVSSAMRAG